MSEAVGYYMSKDGIGNLVWEYLAARRDAESWMDKDGKPLLSKWTIVREKERAIESEIRRIARET